MIATLTAIIVCFLFTLAVFITSEGLSIPQRVADIIDEYTPVIFARVSSRGQKESLPQQVVTVQAYVKQLGFKNKAIVYTIQKSGFKGEQQSIEEMRKLREENPGKRYVAVFRSVDRIGRDTEISLRMRREMSDMGIPMLAMDLPELTGKKPYGMRSVDVLFNILSTVAETGKEREFEAMMQGKAASEKKGVIDGAMLSFYPENYTTRGRSVYRQLWEGKKAVNLGLMSNNRLAQNTGFLYTTNSPARRATSTQKKKRLGEDYRIGDGNTSQPRKILKILDAIHEIDPKMLETYLDVVDGITEKEMINRFAHKRDMKPASSRTDKAQAMHRVSVAFLRDPFNYPNPVTEGNPAIATIVGEVGVGTIEDAYNNPSLYLQKKR